MEEFPVLETERLRLRKPEVRDVPRLIRYAGDSRISDMTLNIPYPYREEDAVNWLNMVYEGYEEKEKYMFAICKLISDELIGAVGLNINTRFNRAELGFWIGVPFWSNGYATEAVEAVLKFGFENIRLNKVYAIHLVNNPSSGKVMVKNGMLKEGKLVEHIKKGEQYLSVFQYGLTRSVYNKW